EKLSPIIYQTFEEEEKAKFDPQITSDVSLFRQRSQSGSRAERTLTGTTSSQFKFGAGVSQSFPSGAAFSAALGTEKDWSSLYSNLHTSRLGLTVTRALLQGASLPANLAKVYQAKLDTQLSQYELAGFVESLVAEVEKAYWHYALARREREIYLASLRLAEQQLKETEERISVGKLAEIDLVAAQAEVALRQEALISATSKAEAMRLRLLRLLNPGNERWWEVGVLLQDQPAMPEVKLEKVEDHCALALKLRPEISQAKLAIQKGEVELVRTKNGLLPRLDFFISLGKTGYARSFGASLEALPGRNYEVATGWLLEWPIGNREAKARYQRARLTRQQAQLALENLCQLVSYDVLSAHLEVTRCFQQIPAAKATRILQEEKLRAETEKFRVGRSTPLLVAQAQRDLLSSQIAEVEAVVNYLLSLVDLFSAEGSLSQRRGIVLEKANLSHQGKP
ncbi:MAG: TolC family protein, partial [Candidatus Omnitrophica bacterium]|nr:TolC family protein [Candidatus Omnitrophota bacterium]